MSTAYVQRKLPPAPKPTLPVCSEDTDRIRENLERKDREEERAHEAHLKGGAVTAERRRNKRRDTIQGLLDQGCDVSEIAAITHIRRSLIEDILEELKE